MRGFLGGLIVGAVMFLAVVAGLTLMRPWIAVPDVAVTAPGPDAGALRGPSDAGAGALATTGRDADLVEVAPSVPSREGTRPEPSSLAERADTTPAGKPSVADDTAGLAGPGSSPSTPGIAVATEPPQAPATPTVEPPAPLEADAPAAAEREPARPAPRATAETAPELGGGGGTATEAPPSAPASAQERPPAGIASAPIAEPEAGSQPDTAPAAAAAPPAVAVPVEPAPSAGGEPAGVEKAPAPTASPVPAPVAPDRLGGAPDRETAPAAEPGTDHAPEPGRPRTAALPQAGSTADALGQRTPPGRPGGRIGTPVRPLTERDDTARAEPATEPAAEADAPARPPLEAFAAPFDNAENKPLMSIILIDDAQAIGAEALDDFPYPLTFAVDARLPDAAERMARHRAHGFEVVTLVHLPASATPKDAETSLETWLARLPQTVAVLEDPDKSLQRDRAISERVAAIVGQSGRGLILQNNGLNTAQKLAARAGVPSAVVFRDFDGAGQPPTVIRRFLDQAAFRARQEGAVIMLGRVRPDTISALILWGLQDRASRVALAPVSAVLRRDRPAPN